MSHYSAFEHHAKHLQEGARTEGSLRESAGVSVGQVSCLSPHISPHVKYYTGARVLKAHRGGPKDDQLGGGQRGEIKGFSKDSRHRLLQTIESIRMDAELPLFITLTYPETFPDARASKVHLDTFCKRIKRAFADVGLIWKLEPQQRGAPHYHMMMWGWNIADNQNWFPLNWFEVAGSGDPKHLQWHMGGFGNQHCVQPVRTWNGVRSYASKYLGKTFEVQGWEAVGRYWGVIGRDNIPFGELVEQEVTREKAIEIMRYQRRFTHREGTGKKSSTIFCDVDQWIEKIGLTESH